MVNKKFSQKYNPISSAIQLSTSFHDKSHIEKIKNLLQVFEYNFPTCLPRANNNTTRPANGAGLETGSLKVDCNGFAKFAGWVFYDSGFELIYFVFGFPRAETRGS